MKRAIMRASIEIDWYTIQQNYGERVTNHSINAQVAKLVDALGSGLRALTGVGVQVPLSAPFFSRFSFILHIPLFENNV